MRHIRTHSDLKLEVDRLVDYMWADEKTDYEEHPQDREVHIFETLQALNRYFRLEHH